MRELVPSAGCVVKEELDAWWRTESDSMTGCVVECWTSHAGIDHWTNVRDWISVEGKFGFGKAQADASTGRAGGSREHREGN